MRLPKRHGKREAHFSLFHQSFDTIVVPQMALPRLALIPNCGSRHLDFH